MKRFMTGTVAVLLALSAAEAKAAILLDFALPQYALATGQTTFTTVDQGIAVTVSTVTGTLQHKAQGFGVNSSVLFEDPGEVGLREVLLTGFNSSQYVHSVAIERFFSTEFPSAEEGQYRINGGAWTSFFATGSTGFYSLSIGQGGVNSLEFRGTGNILFNDDFAVRGLTVDAPVPEPATMLLLGSGLAGVFMHRRRKKNQVI